MKKTHPETNISAKDTHLVWPGEVSLSCTKRSSATDSHLNLWLNHLRALVPSQAECIYGYSHTREKAEHAGMGNRETKAAADTSAPEERWGSLSSTSQGQAGLRPA